MEERVIFHIDVNSAYLSWTAVRMLQLGETTEDIREIPSIVGGNTDERHGIVLAKSILAKRYNIKTGEPVVDALKKCPNLKIFKPNYRLFMDCSNAMYNLLYEYSPKIQRYSVDEVFIDMSHFKENYMEKAIEIQNRIRSELGFNVNIGISTNKLLAKMASDLEPKNAIHTLFKEEIQNKMWTLPVDNLFMVGRATKSKLDKLNINTIGELANFDIGILESIFKSHGKVIHNYANGIEELRNNNSLCRVISISIKGFNFERYIHQRTLSNYIDCTEEIYKEMVKAFNEAWRGEPIRQLGVRVSELCNNEFFQSSLFDSKKLEKQRALDKTIDSIRERYGNYSVIRSTFLHSGIKAINGGNGEDNYPMMGSIL